MAVKAETRLLALACGIMTEGRAAQEFELRAVQMKQSEQYIWRMRHAYEESRERKNATSRVISY